MTFIGLFGVIKIENLLFSENVVIEQSPSKCPDLLTVLTVHSKIECRELMFTFTVYLIKVFIVWCKKCIIYRPTIHNYEQIIQNFNSK